jgi:AraC family ethanolamine operon transcriptional activator
MLQPQLDGDHVPIGIQNARLYCHILIHSSFRPQSECLLASLKKLEAIQHRACGELQSSTQPARSLPIAMAHSALQEAPCGPKWVANGVFNDLDELIFAAREWDLDFMQLEPGRFRGRLLQLLSPRWSLAHAQFGSPLRQEGLPPRHLRNIAIPATPRQNFRWRGQEITGNCMMLFPMGGELESVSGPDFEVFIIAVPEQDLNQLCSDHDLPDLQEMTAGAEVIQCDPNTLQQLRHSLGRIVRQVRLTPGLIQDDSFDHALETGICSQLICTMATGRLVHSLSLPRRQRHVLKIAQGYIKEHAHEGVSIHEVCQHLNISERSLRAAFHHEYGISPKAFLKGYQLTQVRRRLCHATTERIQDVANAWGFWHMGQFSRDYKRMFGELPSQTLSKSY